MPSGNLNPFISQEAVRSVLDAFLYMSKSPDDPNPLESLVLVDEFLADPDFPPSSVARTMATQRLVASIITQSFTIVRQNFDISPLADATSRATALADLKHIVGYNSPDLFGWATLYYRFVRVDLNISSESMAETFSVDERTLRRYFAHGVRRLTEQLVEAEWDARTRQRKRRLLSLLPSRLSTPLFGRQLEYAHIQTILLGQPPFHLQITGTVGIGKSTLIQQFLFERIEAGHIDRLVWLCTPPSVEFVRQHLIETLTLEDSSIDLREYLQVCRTALVLDDIESTWAGDLLGLEELLNDLVYAEVYLISRHFLPLANLRTNIHLSELKFTEATQLMQAIASQDTLGEELSDGEIEKLWSKVGGNPQAIRLAAHNLAFGVGNDSGTVEGVYSAIYNQLPDNLRSAWFRCSILPPDQIEVPAGPQQTPYSPIVETELYSLRRQHLLEISDTKPGTFYLTTSARQFLVFKYQNCAAARRLVEEIIVQFEQLIESDPLHVLYIIESILLRRWPPLAQDRWQHWITALVGHGLHHGHHAHWSEILGQYRADSTEPSPEIDVAYGVCLRRLSDWRKAQRVFETVIADCGRHGLFLVQARALLELAVLCRYQGNYRRATALLRKVENTAIRLQDKNLIEGLRVERAQIAVDRGDALDAEALLSGLNLDDARLLILCSDVHRLTGDYVACRRWASRALQVSGADKVAAARIHTMVARSYELQQQWQDARHYFEVALNLLEHDTDNLFTIGRARLNLGAVLIREKSYDEAHSLLKGAEAIQSKLGDRVALSTTRHNLRLLKTLTLG